MFVFLTGATGFIGTHLVRALIQRGDSCLVVSRSGNRRDPWKSDRVRMIAADPAQPGPWQKEVDGAGAVINLAGHPIDPRHRWTRARKRELRESRLATTQNVVQAIEQAALRPATLISGSAVGYYGARGDTVLDESSSPGDDFLAGLAVDWENAALAAETMIRVVRLRTGVVMGGDGGALQPLLPIFRTGLGGPWGNGRQWWSWIHLDDVIGLILFAVDRGLTGPINLTAPEPVTVNDFAAALGRALHRPALLRAPEFALRLALGEAATTLLDLQRVVPRRALDEGYRFRFTGVEAALAEIAGPHAAATPAAR